MGRFHTIIPASVFSPSELLLLGLAGREGTAVQPTSPSFEEQHHTRTWRSPPGKFELASQRSAGAPRTQRCRLGGQMASTVTVSLHVPNASEPQAAKTGPWQVETSLRKGICRHESTHPSDIGSGALPSSRAALMLARFSLNHLSADSSNIDIDAPVPHSIRLYRNSIRPAHRLIIRHTDRPSLNPPTIPSPPNPSCATPTSSSIPASTPASSAGVPAAAPSRESDAPAALRPRIKRLPCPPSLSAHSVNRYRHWSCTTSKNAATANAKPRTSSWRKTSSSSAWPTRVCLLR